MLTLIVQVLGPRPPVILPGMTLPDIDKEQLLQDILMMISKI